MLLGQWRHWLLIIFLQSNLKIIVWMNNFFFFSRFLSLCSDLAMMLALAAQFRRGCELLMMVCQCVVCNNFMSQLTNSLSLSCLSLQRNTAWRSITDECRTSSSRNHVARNDGRSCTRHCLDNAQRRQSSSCCSANIIKCCCCVCLSRFAATSRRCCVHRRFQHIVAH